MGLADELDWLDQWPKRQRSLNLIILAIIGFTHCLQIARTGTFHHWFFKKMMHSMLDSISASDKHPTDSLSRHLLEPQFVGPLRIEEDLHIAILLENVPIEGQNAVVLSEAMGSVPENYLRSTSTGGNCQLSFVCILNLQFPRAVPSITIRTLLTRHLRHSKVELHAAWTDELGEAHRPPWHACAWGWKKWVASQISTEKFAPVTNCHALVVRHWLETLTIV